MTFTTILALIPGFLKFFTQVQWFIQTLQSTPEEQHEDLIKKIQAVFDESANGGRPGAL